MKESTSSSNLSSNPIINVAFFTGRVHRAISKPRVTFPSVYTCSHLKGSTHDTIIPAVLKTACGLDCTSRAVLLHAWKQVLSGGRRATLETPHCEGDLAVEPWLQQGNQAQEVCRGGYEQPR